MRMLKVMFLSFLAGGATCLGSGIVLLSGRPTERSLAVFLGLAVGIMSGVVILDLIPESIRFGSPLEAAIGVVSGIAALHILDSMLTLILGTSKKVHNHSHLLQMGLLIGIGIALHDLPEGIAIAAGHSATERLGLVIALAIALHNIPEGMATAAPLWMGGMGRRKIALIIILISLVTPLGTLLGLILVNISPALIAILLAFAGGAMIYIVAAELIPEAVHCGPVPFAAGTVLGLGVIVLLSLVV